METSRLPSKRRMRSTKRRSTRSRTPLLLITKATTVAMEAMVRAAVVAEAAAAAGVETEKPSCYNKCIPLVCYCLV